MLAMLLAAVAGHVVMPARDCNQVKTGRQLGHGIVKEAVEATLRGKRVVVKRMFKRAVDLEAGKCHDRPNRKVVAEALILHALSQQYGHASLNMYGICNASSDRPFYVAELLRPVRRKDQNVRRALRKCVERLVGFNGGPIIMHDVGWSQFGWSGGDVHAIDLGDISMGTKSSAAAYTENWKNIQTRLRLR